MSRRLLDAAARHPITLPDGSPHVGTVHLARVVSHPNIEIGDFTYYSGFETHADYGAQIAPYLYPGAPERLLIGRFCQIAHGARFVTSSANHLMTGFSTYPFAVLDPETMGAYAPQAQAYGDTIVGNDVWMGFESVVMPGVTVGNGAIVGARAVVTRDVPDYAIVAGNPARVVRMRFAPEVVARLLAVAWWNWDPEAIERNVAAIAGADIDRLEECAGKRRKP